MRKHMYSATRPNFSPPNRPNHPNRLHHRRPLTSSPDGIFMFLRNASISGGHSCIRSSMSGMRRE